MSALTRRHLPWALPALCLLGLLAHLPAPRRADGLDVPGFGRLPVLAGGRIKPLDTIARTALLELRGKQSVRVPGGRTLTAAEWLLEMAARPEVADGFPVFTIDDPDVLGALGLPAERGRYFAYKELAPKFDELDRIGNEADRVESAQRSRYQRAAVSLRDRVLLYQRLQNTLAPAGAEDFPRELDDYGALLPRIVKAVASHMSSKGVDRGTLALIAPYFKRFQGMAQLAEFRALPPRDGEGDDAWETNGDGLLEGLRAGVVHPDALGYARLLAAWKASDPKGFNEGVAAFDRWLTDHRPDPRASARSEELFNRLDPFGAGMTWYVLALLCAFTAWIAWPDTLKLASFRLLGMAWIVHTAGLVARIVLQGRPPVTNLYSSAVFVGWVAVGGGLWMEWRQRTGVAAIAASAIGFVTLIIAHHLAMAGDSMEMMRAVLDSNFWLSTHVVAVTVGYGSTFLAGALGIYAILRAAFAPRRPATEEGEVARATYGVICFALFFSFTGTVLGGIWADQSWGRFWGWDPKENGALLIVLWNAIILHARSGRMIGARGLAVMAVIGNIVTALSWFGVNMLGIGLHSYGFMDKAFWWLAVFTVTQVAIVALAARRPAS